MNWIPAVNDFVDIVKKNGGFEGIDDSLIKKNAKVFIQRVKAGKVVVEQDKESVLSSFCAYVKAVFDCPLKPVINATGIVLHTNLGRSPISPSMIECLFSNELKSPLPPFTKGGGCGAFTKGGECGAFTKVGGSNCFGYTNIEFDLSTGKRAYRDDHLVDVFSFLTGTEDVVVVNNNAASLYLILKTFAKGKEIIISRGELIEIGGSFRIPDIMADAGAVLREVGTTNCTRISDYEKAINADTALILKAHTSNYTVSGYTESVELEELVQLAKKRKIPFVYDAGSGLIRKPKLLEGTSEPVISECIERGVDIVCFSGDKLMGATQAGIILGKAKYLSKMKKHPMMRVLRADKLKIANLYHAISMFRSEDELMRDNVVFRMLSQTVRDLEDRANRLSDMLAEKGVKNKVLKSVAQIGGGSLPDLRLDSFEIEIGGGNGEEMYFGLMALDKPVVGLLRKRKVYLDVFTVDNGDVEEIVRGVERVK